MKNKKVNPPQQNENERSVPTSNRHNDRLTDKGADLGGSVKEEKEEYELRVKKLKFETHWGKFFEGFKAIGSIVAALGVIVTLFLAFYQQGQNRVSRDDERFDRSVARVGSSQTAERLTGLAGLQQFLVSKDADREKSALLYLVNATTIETDPTVRSAMLDTFNSLRDLSLSPDALNAALQSARDRNRALFKRFLSRPWTATRDKPSYNVDFPELAMDPIQQPEKDQVLATAGLIAALVRAGAKADDLSGIFCLNCTFNASGRKVNLSGVNFDEAMLRGTSFLAVNLQGASFRNADLLAADFTSASLRNAKFTADTVLVAHSLGAAYATRNLMNVRGTNFACADLSGADFSGRLIFGLILNDPIFGGYGRDEFFAADLRESNFIGAQFFVAVPQSSASVEPGSYGLGKLSPVGQALGSGPSDPLDYAGTKYVAWTFTIADDTGFTVPLKSGYRRSLIMILSSFEAAKNLSAAKIPPAMLRYLEANKAILEKPVRSYDCKGQRSFDITQMFHQDDVGPKNTQP